MEGNVPQGSFIGTFLDSPIISTDRDEFFAVLTAVKNKENLREIRHTKRAQALLKLAGDLEISPLEPEQYEWFGLALRPALRSEQVIQARELANNIVKALKQTTNSGGKIVIGGLEEVPIVSDDALLNYNKMVMLDEIVTAIAVSSARGVRQAVSITVGNLTFHGDSYYGIAKIAGEDEWLLMTYTQLLMLKDVYYARFNVFFAISLLQSEVDTQRLTEDVRWCLKWETDCVSYYGNKGYELLKSIEPMTKCNLIRMTDPVLGQNGSYQAMGEKVKEKERSLSQEGSPLVDRLMAFLEQDRDLTIAVELFGLQKLAGHPLVDPRLAGRSVKEEARKKIDYLPTNINRLRNNCCRLYTEGYIGKNNRWPPLIFPSRKGRSLTRLEYLYSINELRINKTSYPLDDWEGVRFAPHLTVEGFSNFLDLMDDKSVSLYREDCRLTWQTGKKPGSSKRLLIELLSRPGFSVLGLIEQIRRGDIPFSWLIVSLYPKEREMKVAARLFSMMVIEMRVYFAACEANIAEYVYPCIPPQTMTLSKQDVGDLFFKLTAPYTNEELLQLYFEIDLSRWNLRWHPEVIDPLGEDLNDMFGKEGMFTVIHHFFKSCIILIRVPSAPPEGIDLPDIPESDLCFYNHEVGFEGIAQKLWSYATFGMIDLSMTDHEGPYYLVGQGDNQVLLMTISTQGMLNREEEVRKITSHLTKRIELECALVGQEAKPEECIQSTTVVTYSKNVYIEGTEYFTTLKACSRIFPRSSSDFPSVNGSIGAISSACLAASESMSNPLLGYPMQLFHLALYLIRCRDGVFVETCCATKHWRERLTSRVITALLILPGPLGGLNIATFPDFIYKGGADATSKAYAGLVLLQDGLPLARKLIHGLSTDQWFAHSPDIKVLLDDPFSLPLSRGRTAEQSIYSDSLDCVKGVVVNKELKEILSSDVEKFSTEMRRLCSLCEPFNPVMLSDVLGFSIVGVEAALTHMFTSTRTVQSLLHGTANLEYSLCLKVIHTGTLYASESIFRISRLKEEERKSTSIFSDVEKMRGRWIKGREEQIKNIVGVTNYTPFDFKVSLSSDVPLTPGFKFGVTNLSLLEQLRRRGPHSPYLGIDTVEKRTEYGYKIATSTSAAQAFSRLLLIATQPSIDSSFIDLVTVAAKTRSDFDVKDLIPYVSHAVGGSIAHRYSAVHGVKGAYGINMRTFGSHCIINTDHAPPISASAVDFPLMVQEHMIFGTAAMRAARKKHPEKTFMVISTDSVPLVPLPDAQLKCSGAYSGPIPQYLDNKLVMDNNLVLRRVAGFPITDMIRDLPAASLTTLDPLYALRARVRESFFQNSTALRIVDSSSRFSYFKIIVSELRGGGLTKMCDAFSLEIALAVGNLALRGARDGLRWTPVPAIISLATAAAKRLAPIASHPSMANDELLSSMGIVSPFRYKFSGETVEGVLLSRIASLSFRALLNPQSKVYRSPEVIFKNDAPGVVRHVLIRRIRMALFRGVLVGEILPEEFLDTLGIVLPYMSKRADSLEDEISNVKMAATVLLEGFVERGLPSLSADFRHITTGKAIRAASTSSIEVLRLLRSQHSSEHIARVFNLSLSGEASLPRLFTHPPVPRREGWEAPFRRVRHPRDVDRRGVDLFEIHRLRYRPNGLSSAAAYSYSRIASLGKGKVCMVLGCGFGSGAAMLIAAGASHVIGLDLWSDLDPEELMRGVSLPPMLHATKQGEKFTRVVVSPVKQGDMRDPQTVDLLREYSGAGTAIFCDINFRTREDLILVITNLFSFSPGGTVFVRFRGLLSEIDDILLTLTISDCQCDALSVFSTVDRAEVWISITFPFVLNLLGASATKIPVAAVIGSHYDALPSLPGGPEYLKRLIYGPYIDFQSSSLEDEAIELSLAMGSSIGGLDHRFSYRQFSQVLERLMVNQILRSSDPWDALLSVVERMGIDIEFSSRTVAFTVSREMYARILKPLARLL